MADRPQISTAESNILEVVSAINEFRSTVEMQERVGADAADLEKQAKRMRRGTAAAAEEAWYNARDKLTNPGEEIEEAEFLYAALAFAAIPPPKSVLPQTSRLSSRPGRHKGGRGFTGTPFISRKKTVSPDDIVGLFESMQDGEPIVFPEGQGMLTGQPKVFVREKLGGITIQFGMGMYPVDVKHRVLGQEQVFIRISDASAEAVAIGIEAIDGYASNLKIEQVPDRGGHGRYKSNLSTLETELNRISGLGEALGLAIDLSSLVAEVEKGKAKAEAYSRIRRRRRPVAFRR